jgi:hypothetical protein
VLGLLRQDDVGPSEPAATAEPAAGTRPSRAPQRTLGELDRLVADTRAAGLTVTVELTGALHALPAAVAREGYRIVQEGLTNAARHAGRPAVTLRITVTDGSLEIELVNPAARPGGVGPGRQPDRRRRGRGLAGMRERVTLLGGRLSAGLADGDWRVTVWLPTTGPSDRRVDQAERPADTGPDPAVRSAALRADPAERSATLRADAAVRRADPAERRKTERT